MRNFFYLLLTACTMLTFVNASFGQLDNAIKFKIIAPDGWYDETIIRMDDSATVEFDGMLDAWKMFTPNNAIPSLYSYSSEQWAETINAIPFPAKDTAMGLMMRTIITGGQFTMETEFQGAMVSHMRVGIKDLVTGDFYILDQDTSFLFPVVTSPDDYERFHVCFSPKPVVEVSGYNAALINHGAINWTSNLYSEDATLMSSDLIGADSVFYENLANGNYYVISVDANGFVDTTTFTIDVAEEEEETGEEAEEPSGEESKQEESLSLETNESMVSPVIKTIGDQHIVSGNFAVPTDVHVYVYSTNGSLVSNDFIQASQELEYILPDNGPAMEPVIVIVIAGENKFDYKLVY